MITLTEKQAYAAMYYFLEQIYENTKSDAIGGLLGDMSLLADGTPADSSIVNDWNNAIHFALNGGKAGDLTITPVKK